VVGYLSVSQTTCAPRAISHNHQIFSNDDLALEILCRRRPPRIVRDAVGGRDQMRQYERLDPRLLCDTADIPTYNDCRRGDFFGQTSWTAVTTIAPGPRDIVIKKQKPSGFFGTNLASYLTLFGCDSLIVVGTTTSGCVRATVVDAFSLNYRVILAEEGCFDRSEASHAVSLCDMHAKYADVDDRVAERREGGARTRHVRLYRHLPRHSRHERFPARIGDVVPCDAAGC
jgi:Isochorismatase family